MRKPIDLARFRQAAARIDDAAADTWRRFSHRIFGPKAPEIFGPKAPETGSTPQGASPRVVGSTTKVLTQDRIELLSEMLHINKERIERGEVRIRKELVTENQVIEVPVTREELVVERCSADGGRSRLELLRDQKQIRIPLWEEVIKVEKRAVVNEVVDISKRDITELRNLNETVRHEELKVEPKGDVEVKETRDTRKAA